MNEWISCRAGANPYIRLLYRAGTAHARSRFALKRAQKFKNERKKFYTRNRGTAAPSTRRKRSSGTNIRQSIEPFLHFYPADSVRFNRRQYFAVFFHGNMAFRMFRLDFNDAARPLRSSGMQTEGRSGRKVVFLRSFSPAAERTSASVGGVGGTVGQWKREPGYSRDALAKM